MLSQTKLHAQWRQAHPIMCLCGHGAGFDISSVVFKVHVEMEDNAIPEEYFTCHGDKLFDSASQLPGRFCQEAWQVCRLPDLCLP